MKELIGVRELAAFLGVSPGTITHYTQLGLLEITEISGNKKLYNKKDILKRFERIQQARKDGYPLVLIRGLLEESKY